MATSPNYGWLEPDNTDLVKNGALAIRTLGNAIDTTMATMTPKSTFTAKGSIAAATAASTPANLSVGANDTMLVADSTASTGLAYKSATTLYPWTTWTPTLGGLTLGNGTVTARYQKVGKTVNWYFRFLLGSTSLVTSGAYFTLPSSTAQTYLPGQVLMRDAGTAWWFGACIIDTGYAYINNQKVSGNFTISETITATSPFVWTTSDFIVVNGTYEEA
jgi:hypothetical protein